MRWETSLSEWDRALKKKKRKVPATQLSLKLLRKEGYLCAVVEHWNHFSCIRKDLFGFIDIIAIRGCNTLAVQTTSAPNFAARIKKIRSIPHHETVLRAWGIEVHGWKKKKNRYEVRREMLYDRR